MAAREFALCATCASRQNAETRFVRVPSAECFICEGLVLRTPRIEVKVLRQISRYQFKTFSVGVIIPAAVQEREDRVRSELQIRGMETIKSQTAKEIAGFVGKRKRKRIDKGHPELTILVDLERDEVSATAKSVFVYGRYTKPRGISQRRELCEYCSGAGCAKCQNGYSDIPSMEVIVTKRLTRIFRSSRAKFTWIGSEDQDSIVYSPGRPFVVEVKDPKLREIPSTLNLITGKGAARILGAKVLKKKPVSIPPFVFKTRAFIEPTQHIDPAALRRLKKLKGIAVQYRNNKAKTVDKKVYSVSVESKGGTLVAEIKLDGGLPVKRFVSGESTSPSLAELLNSPLTCQRFDILRVWESKSLSDSRTAPHKR